jgi:hypothetical protein
MNLSIIIVNWNTADLLQSCLVSIYAHSPAGRFEVLVVDNASTDASVAMVRREFPQVRLLANQQNGGFAAANNQAIRRCTGEMVLLLNPDTIVKPGALAALVNFLQAHPRAGAAGPLTLNPDGTLQISCYPAPTLLRELWRLLHIDALYPLGEYPMARWPQNQSRPVDTLLGACLLLRREVLEQVGLLDEAYFIYSEEVDLCTRIRRAGWPLYWLPQAQIIHYGGQSTRQVAADMFLRLYQGKLLYFRKHHGRLAALGYKLILLLTSMPRLLLTPLAWFEPPARRRAHLTLAGFYFKLLTALPDM